MPVWLLGMLGVAAAIFVVRKVRRANPNNEIVARDKEKMLLDLFEAWDRREASQEVRVSRLQELAAKGELPPYVEDVSDPEAVRALVTQRVESADS